MSPLDDLYMQIADCGAAQERAREVLVIMASAYDEAVRSMEEKEREFMKAIQAFNEATALQSAE